MVGWLSGAVLFGGGFGEMGVNVLGTVFFLSLALFLFFDTPKTDDGNYTGTT